VTVRFSNFAGIPTVADNDPQGAGPRGFAVRFHLGEHVHTDIISHSVDSFPVRTAEGLVEFLNALIGTDPAGPHPNAIEQFLGAHPAALRFVQIPKPIPTSFARESFFAVSAFKFTNADGMSRYGRYRVLPVEATNISTRPKPPHGVQISSSTRSRIALQGNPSGFA
jgi:catalase